MRRKPIELPFRGTIFRLGPNLCEAFNCVHPGDRDHTTRPDEVEALVREWRTKTEGRRTVQRGTFTRDRERPNTCLQIVEFPSYEDAMANSASPRRRLSPKA